MASDLSEAQEAHRAAAIEEQVQTQVQTWLAVPLLLTFLQELRPPFGWTSFAWNDLRSRYAPFRNFQNWRDWVDFAHAVYEVRRTGQAPGIHSGGRTQHYADAGARFAKRLWFCGDNTPID